MMKEANKFREHQSRELMIEMLENQLLEREKCLVELKGEINAANAALRRLTSVREGDFKPIL